MITRRLLPLCLFLAAAFHSAASAQQAFRGVMFEVPLESVVTDDMRPDANVSSKVQAPKKLIAVLLPRKGTYADSAAKILDGYLAAYFASGLPRAEIKVYDTGEGRRSMLSAYDEAVADGAQLVVGPLVKRNVRALADMRDMPVPVLALNYLDEDMEHGPQLFQLGLAPEDEARRAAESAMAQGLSKAVGVIGLGIRSERIAAAFRARYEELGGVLLTSVNLPENLPDYLGTLTQLPGLEGRAGHRFSRASRIMPVPFDMIFLAVDADASRMLMPEIKYLGPRDIPVYATSAVLDRPIASSDRDGMRICDMPLLLASGGSPETAGINGALGSPAFDDLRLYALGHDAYSLSEKIASGSYVSPLQGLSGMLTLTSGGVVRRTVSCEQIVNGA